MSTINSIKEIYLEVEFSSANPECYYLLRLADLYGEELLKEYL